MQLPVQLATPLQGRRQREAVELYTCAIPEAEHEEAITAATKCQPLYVLRQPPLTDSSAELGIEGLHGSGAVPQCHNEARGEHVKGAGDNPTRALLHSPFRDQAALARVGRAKLHDAACGGAHHDAPHIDWEECAGDGDLLLLALGDFKALVVDSDGVHRLAQVPRLAAVQPIVRDPPCGSRWHDRGRLHLEGIDLVGAVH
mmetsp:Transcript_25442/g.64696  ORF Transcript_25442/g.64696 Transcript_25442/m.64696 type:complete len:201 (+) Transcript_25442:266-868(+)